METLATLLHIAVWYGVAMLTLVAMLTGIGMLVTGSVRTVITWLKPVTPDRIGRGLLCLPAILVIVLAVITSQNGGDLPSWLDPPPLPWQKAKESESASLEVTEGEQP